MEWKEEYSVKVPSLDAQHKRLFVLFNDLKNENAAGNDARVNSVIKELLDYTLKHFFYEEQLLKEYGYSSLEEHQDVHDRLTGSVMEYKRKMDRKEKIDVEAMLDFLYDWLINHILKTDMMYSDFLKNRKVP